MSLHVLHLVHRFGTGGLENVVVQLVDGLAAPGFRHTVVALTEVDPAFQARVQRQDVRFIALHKPPGQPFALYPRFFRLLRELRPDAVHSCNLAALEFMPVAWAAGVPVRVHAEHGWDFSDPQGQNRLHQRLRRCFAHFVQRVVAVSDDIASHLRERVGIPARQLRTVLNGVDTARFRPLAPGDAAPPDWPYDPQRHWVLVAVGRLDPVKNHGLLLQALAQWRHRDPQGSAAARLVLIGDGPLRAQLAAQVQALGLGDCVQLAGNRADVPDCLRHAQAFAMPSIAEGTSCTLQEALASGLGIMASAVGGNPAVLDGGRLGLLLPSGDVQAWAHALAQARQGQLPADPALRRAHACQRFDLRLTLRRYAQLFAGEEIR